MHLWWIRIWKEVGVTCYHLHETAGPWFERISQC